LDIIGGLAKSYHVKVLVALQPNLYVTRKHLSAHEQTKRQEGMARPGWPEIMATYLPRLQQILKTEAQKHGLQFVSLLDVFDSSKKPIFFMMNAILATAVTAS
jgi:hypothetical protein